MMRSRVHCTARKTENVHFKTVPVMDTLGCTVVVLAAAASGIEFP